MAISDIFGGIASIATSILGNAQLGSLGRKVGFGIAVAMASKYGITSASLETVVAGAAALWSIASSVKAHLPSQQVSTGAVKDAALTAAQAATAAILAQLQQQGVIPAAQAPAA